MITDDRMQMYYTLCVCFCKRGFKRFGKDFSLQERFCDASLTCVQRNVQRTFSSSLFKGIKQIISQVKSIHNFICCVRRKAFKISRSISSETKPKTTLPYKINYENISSITGCCCVSIVNPIVSIHFVIRRRSIY